MSETPTHYQGTIQPIEYMRETMTAEEYAGFLKGNIIKYIARAGKKDGEPAANDVNKAGQYMDWLEELYNRREAAERLCNGNEPAPIVKMKIQVPLFTVDDQVARRDKPDDTGVITQVRIGRSCVEYEVQDVWGAYRVWDEEEITRVV